MQACASVIAPALAGLLIAGCPADEAVKQGTKCDAKCPIGSRPNQSKDAAGLCGGGGDVNGTTNSGSVSGMCVGGGECMLFCEPPNPCCGGERWTDKSYECDKPCSAGEDPGSAGSGGGSPSQSHGTSGSGGRSGGSTPSDPGGGSDEDAGTAMSMDPPSEGSQTTPGTDKEHALDLGVLGATAVTKTKQYVGTRQSEAYYKFEIAHNAIVTYGGQKANASVQIQLFPNKTQIDEKKPYTAINVAPDSDMLQTIQLEKGIYYLRAVPNSGSPIFDLTVSAEEYAPLEHDPEPGEDPESAQDVGTLGTDSMVFGGYVGGTDPEDFYRFELASNTTVAFSGDHVFGNVYIQIFAYAATINESMPLYQINAADGGNTDMQSMPSGSYLVRVIPINGNPLSSSLYSLNLNTAD
jgi:hypothetical protein